MKLKMENPDKVRNIVIGSYDGLNSLYGAQSERMKKLERLGIVRPKEEDKFELVHSQKNLQYLFENVPASLKKGMKANVI